MDQNTLILCVVLFVAIVGLRAFQSKKGKKLATGKKQRKDPKLDELLAQGRYADAGRLALQAGRDVEAMDYFLRGNDPNRAAQIAVQRGDSLRAAELFEKAREWEKAAQHYDRAGMKEKAAALRGGGAEPTAIPPPMAPGAAATDSAEALLAAGDIRGAADAYRSAGLYDEAIHLYVNILGLPGMAAALLAERGNHERAAELYELAGEIERAADSWISIAEKAPEPELYVERIQRLSDEKCHTFLKEQTSARPLSRVTVELHYQFGLSLERRGDRTQAVEIFITIRTSVGEYRDVGPRLSEWQSTPGPGGPPPPSAPSQEWQSQPSPRGFAAPAPVSSAPVRIEIVGQRATSNPAIRLELTGAQANALAKIKVQTVTLENDSLAEEEITILAVEAAQIAQQQIIALTTSDIFPNATADEPVAPTIVRTRSDVRANVALVAAPAPEILIDSKVHAARNGPGLSTLNRYIDGKPCDLGNIEVYYRLGLAHLARGDWAEALTAFRSVDDASPGYRDAWARAEKIEEWQGELAPKLTALGVAGTAVRRKEPSRYSLHGEIGRGGMAVVYRAKDGVLGRDVALKFLAEEMLQHQEARDMFAREARSVAQLNHPNVVTIYDFGTLEGRTFIAMELIEGTTVKDMLETRSNLSVMESLRIITQLLEALQFAHERNIIHRDIKPSNIMVTPTGLVKLMDFGLAKTVKGREKASMIAGTPGYMPPEQIIGDELDARTDVFAVGVSLYEMLTGKMPFKKLDRSVPASLRDFNPTIPKMLDEIVRRAIALMPDDRFQSAAALNLPLAKISRTVGDRLTGDLRVTDASAGEAG